MPSPRQKQGVGGINSSSSIAYTRWEPLSENDNEDCDAEAVNGEEQNRVNKD